MNLHKSIILTLAKVIICSLEGSLAKSYKMLSNTYILTPLINIIKFQILNLPTFATMLHTLVKLGHTYFREDMCNCMTTIHWVLYHLNYLALPKRQKLQHTNAKDITKLGQQGCIFQLPELHLTLKLHHVLVLVWVDDLVYSAWTFASIKKHL